MNIEAVVVFSIIAIPSFFIIALVFTRLGFSRENRILLAITPSMLPVTIFLGSVEMFIIILGVSLFLAFAFAILPKLLIAIFGDGNRAQSSLDRMDAIQRDAQYQLDVEREVNRRLSTFDPGRGK